MMCAFYAAIGPVLALLVALFGFFIMFGGLRGRRWFHAPDQNAAMDNAFTKHPKSCEATWKRSNL